MKIGPIFRLSAGDPGWSLHANSEADYWILQLITGAGDCPCGCTEWSGGTYQVFANGIVKKFSSAIRNPVAQKFSAPEFHKNSTQSYVSLQGRRLGTGNILFSVGKGVYITTQNNGEVKKTSVFGKIRK